jgi:hypothetical protein
MPSEYKNKILIHASFLNICGLSALLKHNNSKSTAHNSTATYDENLPYGYTAMLVIHNEQHLLTKEWL